MKILAIEHETPGLSAPDFHPHLEAEARGAWKLYRDAVIREMYFTQEDHRAVLVMECGDREEAREYLDSLPLVQAGLIRFEILPLKPYDGFERLFKENA